MTHVNTRHLRIDGMKGDITVQRVKAALGSVQGVVVNSVQVGGATITCESPSNCETAIAALGSAGFKARETLGTVVQNGAAAPALNGGKPTVFEPSAANQAMVSEGACGAIGSAPCGVAGSVAPQAGAEAVAPLAT